MSPIDGFSISTGSFYPDSTDHSIIRAEKLGFSSVELVIQSSEINYNFQRHVNADYYRRLRRKLRDRSIVTGSVHSPFLPGTDVFSATTRMEILQHSLDITNLLEADILVLHPYHIFSSYEGAVQFFSTPAMRVEEFLLPQFMPFLRKVEGYDIIVAIENIGHWLDQPLTNSPNNLIKLVKALNHDSVRTVIDLFHSEFANNTLAFFEKLSESIIAVHLSDISASQERKLPGQGVTNWRKLSIAVNRLPKLKHRVLEGPSDSRDPELRRSKGLLERLLR